MSVDEVRSGPLPHGGRLLGRGRNGDAWVVPAAASTVVLRRMAGLAAAAAEAELLRERLEGVEAAVAPVGTFTRAGDLWLVYPWVDGAAPDQAVRTADAAAGPVAAAVTAALEQVHAAGLAHGTLSEGNVRVTPTGDVRLLEVGLADLGREPGASRGDDRRALGVLLAALAGPGGRIAPRARHRRARHLPAAVAGAVLGLAATGAATASVVGAGGWRGTPPSSPHGTAGPAAPASAMSSRPTVSAMSPGPTASTVRVDCGDAGAVAPPGRVVRRVDLTGTGCAQPFVWRDGAVLTALADGQTVRFSIGRRGDVLLVGHWRCAPAQLPAIYRPSTGQLFYLTVWPRPGASSASLPALNSGVRHGRPVVIGHRCQHVEVER